MKVGILTDSMDKKKAGLGVYTKNLVENILKIKKDIYLIHYDTNADESVKKIYKEGKEIVIPLPKIHPKMTSWLYVKLPLSLRELELDILHEPGIVRPSILYSSGFKKIITIHDLVPLIFPNTTSLFDIVNLKVVQMLKRNIDAVIVPSENTKRDVIKFFRIPNDKIKVIPYGRDERFRLIKDREELENVRLKYKLPDKFVLFVGTLEPRKNIKNLIKAYYKLKKKGIRHKLVIVGKRGWKYKQIFDVWKSLDLGGDVMFVDYVENEYLPFIYNLADLFVYPSLYEGFGLPPLEAMACGCPVVVSNTSSLPEVVGDAGIKVDPYNIDEIADAMYKILINDDLKDELVKRGLKRAKLFSWEKAAKETLKMYEGCIR